MSFKVFCLRASFKGSCYVEGGHTTAKSLFNGKPIGDKWVPPSVEIVRKDRKAGDFICWHKPVLLVSERAKAFLESAAPNDCEFLEFFDFKKIQYFALNVVNQQSGLLDMEASEADYFPSNPTKLMGVSQYIFRALPNTGKVFKVIEDPSAMFVTSEMRDLLRSSMLTNSVFVPSELEGLGHYLKGEQDPWLADFRKP